MKKAICKYWNRTYGFIMGVMATISTLLTIVTGVWLYKQGKEAGKQEKDEPEEEN